MSVGIDIQKTYLFNKYLSIRYAVGTRYTILDSNMNKAMFKKT